MTGPLVAIGVPVYNGGLYLKECLDSILKQSYLNWECVIIDNKSTDDTNEIAREFVDKDNRFKLFVNDNFVDQTTNWNISYYKSRKEAKYFKIVCADDWLFPEYLEKMIPIIEEDQNVGMCSSYRIDGQSVRCDGLDYYDGNYFNGKEILVQQLKNRIDITGSVTTVLFRNETLRKLEYYPEIFIPNTYHIDTILAYDVLNISRLGFVFDVLSYTRRHNETYTSTISLRFRTDYYSREMLLRKFVELDSSLEKEYQVVRLNYAYFLFSIKMKRNRDAIKWHMKYLQKNITYSEYIKALFTRNIIARKTKFLFKKINGNGNH